MTIALKSFSISLFFSLRFWVTGSFNVALPTLDSREGPFCEEKQYPGVEVDVNKDSKVAQTYRKSDSYLFIRIYFIRTHAGSFGSVLEVKF